MRPTWHKCESLTFLFPPLFFLLFLLFFPSFSSFFILFITFRPPEWLIGLDLKRLTLTTTDCIRRVGLGQARGRGRREERRKEGKRGHNEGIEELGEWNENKIKEIEELREWNETKIKEKKMIDRNKTERREDRIGGDKVEVINKERGKKWKKGQE